MPTEWIISLGETSRSTIPGSHILNTFNVIHTAEWVFQKSCVTSCSQDSRCLRQYRMALVFVPSLNTWLLRAHCEPATAVDAKGTVGRLRKDSFAGGTGSSGGDRHYNNANSNKELLCILTSGGIVLSTKYMLKNVILPQSHPTLWLFAQGGKWDPVGNRADCWAELRRRGCPCTLSLLPSTEKPLTDKPQWGHQGRGSPA